MLPHLNLATLLVAVFAAVTPTGADSLWSSAWRGVPEPRAEPEPELLPGVQPCACVDIRTCPSIVAVLKQGAATPADLGHVKRATCGFRGFVPFVCCDPRASPDPRINLAPDTLEQPDYDDPHFVPKTRGANAIVYGGPGRVYKKPLLPSYFDDDFPNPSPLHPYPFVPNSYHNHGAKEAEFPDQIPPSTGHLPRPPPRSYSSEAHPLHTNHERLYPGHEEPHFHHKGPHPHHEDHDYEDHFSNRPPYNQGLCPPSGTTRHPEDVSAHSRAGSQSKSACEPQEPGRPEVETEGPEDPEDEVDSGREPYFEAELENIHPGLRLLPADRCGVTVDQRIVGGQAAELGAFPWVARIGYLRNGTGRFLYRCGGSLLNDRYVLTAAHCVTNLPGGLELATVRLGELDERFDPDCKELECADPVQDFTPEHVTEHPEYDKPKFRNDVALIRLDRPANLSTYVSPICLPLGSLSSKNYTGQKATVAGWGATNLGVSSSSPFLQWVRLTIVPTQQCVSAYERAGAVVSTSRQLCAGGELMADSCEGDSGGPLMRPEQPDVDSLPRYYLVGVVSFGAKNCGTERMPGVYTRVGAYLTWIMDTLAP